MNVELPKFGCTTRTNTNAAFMATSRNYWSRILTAVTILSVSSACGAGGRATDSNTDMNSIAERYVKLVLQMGNHDAAYVDAYYGPPDWAEAAKANPLTIDEIRSTADSLLMQLESVAPPLDADEMLRLRHQYLTKQLDAMLFRILVIKDEELSFEEEAQRVYDADPPQYDESHFQGLVDAVSEALPPGDGPVYERYARFRDAFVVPPEKLDTVFTAAINECRKRTQRYMELPAEESFSVEYVTDKPWSGYNWYKGNSRSLIQVNTDLPIHIDRAIDLACHEGYPGHHVYNAMLEKNLARDRGWVEFMVYVLFSPQSLIAEGTANYGIEMAFPGKERQEFEREVLFPLAGLDTSGVDQYYRLQDLVGKLSYARNEAARAYLNGDIFAGRAAEYLSRYGLMDEARAAQSVRFIDAYRSYVINYNYGKDLVRQYVEREAGEGATQDQRWAVYADLLASPRLPSDLKAE